MSQQPETLQSIANFLRSRTRGIHPSHSIYITLHEWAAQVERLQAAQGQVVAPDLDKIEAVAFESTNPTDALPLHKYWFRKGFKLGQATSPPAVAPDGALIGEGTKPTPKLPYLPESRTVAEIQAAVDKVAQAGGADEILDSILHDLEHGFVRCERCHSQEETKTLDVVPLLKQLRAALAAQPARVAMVPLPSDVVDKAQRSMNPASFEYAGHLIAQFCRINGLTVGITPGDAIATPANSDELPGMWHTSDLVGGQTDSKD